MEYLSTKQICELSGVKPQTVDYWRKKDFIPYIKKNKRFFFEKEKVLEFLEKRNSNKKEEYLGLFCKVCNEFTKFNDIRTFTRNHLKSSHNINTYKDYYDEYLLINESDKFCEICGEEKKFISNKYSEWCSSNKCRNSTNELKQKIKQSKFKKYGNENYTNRNKKLNTSLEKYGDPYYTNRTKFKQTWKDKSKEEKEKIYQKVFLGKSKSYVQKIEEELKKFNCIIISHDPNNITIQCSKGHTSILNTKFFYTRVFRDNIIPCIECVPLNSLESKIENELYDLIRKYYDGEIIKNDRNILNGKELDIILPDINLAFEFNGIYWHSTLNKHKKYHQYKSLLCRENGYSLFHIFEDEWITNKPLIENKIKNLLNHTKTRIFARKCEIVNVLNKDIQKDFYNKFHIQGWSINKMTYALLFNGKIVAMMSFDTPRTNKKYEWELSRYCTKIDTSVVGGASKLLKYFIKHNNPNNIISYADLSFSNGNLYEKIGFVLDGISEPSYFYVDKNTYMREHRFKYNKNNLKKKKLLLENETENECMERLNTHYKIYDCGKLRYIWYENV